jgi:mitotic spindle assembly checkpoint protein MAD1
LEELLDVHKRELIESTSQVARWRGLVERYGGSTTEIIGLEEMENRKNREDEEDNTGVIVSRSLEEQLRKTEALQSGDIFPSPHKVISY